MKQPILAILVILVLISKAVTAPAQKKDKEEKTKDYVCGMMVSKDPSLSIQHKGETFYFCSRADMEEFKKNPEKYAKKK